MELSQAPAFLAAKVVLLSDACAAAATRAENVSLNRPLASKRLLLLEPLL